MQNKESRNKPTRVGQIIFKKDTENTQWGMGVVFNNCCWRTTYSQENMQNQTSILDYSKTNSKQIKGLNGTPETKKLLEENMGKQLLSIAPHNDFLDITTKAQATKAKTGKWDYIKLKSFFHSKETN